MLVRGQPDVLRADQHLERAVGGQRAVHGVAAAEDLDALAGALAGDAAHGADELGDEGGGRAGVQLGGGGALLQPAGPQDGDPVGHRQRLLLVVGDEQGGDPQLLLEAADLLAQRQPHLGVQRGQRLVEQQDARLEGERAGERDALLLAAGHLVRVAAGVLRKADQLQQLLGALGPLGLAGAAHPQTEGDVVGGGQVREQAVGLEHHAGVALVRGDRGDVLAVDQDLARVVLLEAGQDAQRGGLAAAGRAEQGEQLTGPDGQVEAVQRGGGAEGAAQRAELDGRAAGGGGGAGDGGDGRGHDG